MLWGAVAFLMTVSTVLAGTGEDLGGYSFLPGILALVVWSIAISAAGYRSVTSPLLG